MEQPKDYPHDPEEKAYQDGVRDANQRWFFTIIWAIVAYLGSMTAAGVHYLMGKVGQ